MRRFLVLLSLTLGYFCNSQELDFPLDHPVYMIGEVEDIRNKKSFSSTVKPYSRVSLYNLHTPVFNSYLSKELRYYTKDSTRSIKPLFKKFFKYPSDLFYYSDDEVRLHLNPLTEINFGRSNDNIGENYLYSRGLEIRGSIDYKVAFYTSLTENQAKYPEYLNNIRDSTLVIPYEGFWKQYKETGVDFLRAQGYVDFGISKSISAQLGFGKHFIGNGYRSLILSNYANNYPYLRITTQTKLFDYTNIFAEMIANVSGGSFGLLGTGSFPKKYMALHHLNIKLNTNFHLGFFESVVYGGEEEGLKAQYMNPVIFYRAIEQHSGSEENAFLGMDFKWNIKGRASLYGQLIVDELVVSEVLSKEGWWGNKQGYQIGLKYIDPFGLKDFIIQGEFNKVRPYTYAHKDGFTSYSHYNLPLAHPLGANFSEYIGRINYRLSDQWAFELAAVMAQYGNDVGNENFGRDLLKDYTQRRQDENGNNLDYGNDHLQGNKTDLNMIFSRITFMVAHNLFLDADLTVRREKDTNGDIDTNHLILAGSFRWNMPARRHLF